MKHGMHKMKGGMLMKESEMYGAGAGKKKKAKKKKK